MLKALSMLSLAGLLVAGVLSTPAATAARAPERAVTPMSCGTVSTGAVFGGYRSRVVCEGKQQHRGRRPRLDVDRGGVALGAHGRAGGRLRRVLPVQAASW